MSRRAAAPPAGPAAGSAPGPAARALTLAALLALTLFAFGGVVRNGWFAIDDYAHVPDNPHVRTGVTAAGLAWELTHADCGNWHPLTMFSHMLDVQVFGLAPGGHHAVSLAWHALNAVLLLLVLYGYTGAWWRSACVAALFAVHPLRVESVAWVAERKDVLSTFFFLLVLDAWRRWVRTPSAGRYAWVCVALWLGLLAKPMLVTAPFALLLLDAWPLGRLAFDPAARGRGDTLAARVREKWPLWLTVAAFSAITLRTQGGAGALTIIPGLTLPLRASNAVRTVWIYVGQSLWPRHLVAYVAHDLQPHVAAALCALAALVATTWLVLRLPRRPWLAFGWLWYLGMLVPVINLLQVGPHARADRFTYLPGIGLAVLLVWEVAERVGRSRFARVLAGGLAIAAVAALAIATTRQVARWRDTRTMYAWILEVHPENSIIRWWLADIDLREGHPDAALAGYERVARELPGRVSLHTDIATALAGLGRWPEAREHLARVVREAPTADAWHDLGRMDARRGEPLLAAAELDSALARKPDDAVTLADLAVVQAGAGHLAEGADRFAQAVTLAPARTEYRRAYAETLKRLGRYPDALVQYEAIAAAHPDDVNALMNAAWMRATLPDATARNGAAAVRMAEHARTIPGGPRAALEATCAAAYAETARWPEARAAADSAVAIARAAGSDAEAREYAAQRAAYARRRPWRGAPH